MKKNIFIFIFIVFTAITCFSQELEDILSKYYDATGGKTNWEAVKSIKYTGYTSIMGMDIPYTQYVKRPGMWMVEIYVQGTKILQGYDGTTGWMVNPMMGSKKPTETDKETTKLFKNNSLIGGKLYNIKEMDFKVELEGRENMDGQEVYKLNVTDKDGAVTNFFIDANSFLIVKSISKTIRMGNEVTTESTYSNYKKVNDILISYLLEQKIIGGQFDSQTVSIDKVEINIEIDDNIFKMPKE
jgi:hypothetical protein